MFFGDYNYNLYQYEYDETLFHVHQGRDEE